MARIRNMTPKEQEKAVKTITALLKDCMKATESYPGGNADYAEAHGYYRALRDTNVYATIDGHPASPDALWDQPRDHVRDDYKKEKSAKADTKNEG